MQKFVRKLQKMSTHSLPRQFIYTYLLKSKKDESYYTGIAKDPKQRVIIHNQGKVNHTRDKRPWDLVYQKCHNTYGDARKHEKWLKKKNREYKNKLAG